MHRLHCHGKAEEFHRFLQDITPRKHSNMLKNNRHIRYMWYPYTDSVVVVTNNPVKEVSILNTCFTESSPHLWMCHGCFASMMEMPLSCRHACTEELSDACNCTGNEDAESEGHLHKR